MKLHDVAPSQGARQRKVRVGRGIGSGYGKTAGRGSKGQAARSGGTKAVGFEGGQMPLAQKMPKRGFHRRFVQKYTILNLKDLARFASGTVIDPVFLSQQGLISKHARVKILGLGDAPPKLEIRAHRFSKSAQEKLTAAGGKIEVIV